MKAYIEEIVKSENGFILHLANQPSSIFNAFNGYEEVGVFHVPFSSDYQEGEWVEVETKDCQVVSVKKLTDNSPTITSAEAP